jgi:hypothetical protein
MGRRPTKYIRKVKDLRTRLWPHLSEDELWNHKNFDGFTSIPRTIPIVLSIIDDLTKGAPASSTYLELWCRAFPEMYVSLAKPDEHAFHAGFTGQRARRTWMDRIRKLRDLGFILVAEGSAGELSHSVIINPHVALRRLKQNDHPGISKAKYNALIERGNDIGATDVDRDPKESTELSNDLDDEIPF